MDIKQLRIILKACAEDTRLRIINLLRMNVLTVNELSASLRVNQSTISKHLARLRLIKIVFDRRQGNCVYYRLNQDSESLQNKIVKALLRLAPDVKVFIRDAERLKKLQQKS